MELRKQKRNPMVGYEIKEAYLNLRQNGIRNGTWFKGRENEGKSREKWRFREGESTQKRKWPNGEMAGNNVRETGECGKGLRVSFLALVEV